MKKLLILLMLALVIVSCLVLAGCSGECSHSGGTATCDAKAKCASCGELYGEILGHNWAEATCLAPKTCLRCDKTEGASLGHDEIIEVIEPTCTDQGITNISCSRCSYVAMKNPVDELGHDIKTGVEKEPTCFEEGSEIVYCTRCTYGTKKSIPMVPHDEQYEVIEPTCEEAGITKVTCANCSYESTKDPVNKLGHDLLTELITAADCYNDGQDRVFCSRCSYEYTKIVETLGHDVIDMGVEPTCTEDGYEKMGCSRCDYVESETPIKTTGHDLSYKGTCARCYQAKDMVLAEQVESITPSHEGGGSANVDKLFDGEKKTTGIYNDGNMEYFPSAIGDTLTITLKQEIYVNEICLYATSNWTSICIYIYDELGNQTMVVPKVDIDTGDSAGGNSGSVFIDFGKSVRFKSMKIECLTFKWSSGRTQKISEIEIFKNDFLSPDVEEEEPTV